MSARSFAMRGGALAAVVAIAAVGSSCGADFDPGSRITDLRVMAVRADVPYAKPGEAVNLDSLWFDPHMKDPARSRQWAWATCVDPIASDVVSCLQSIAQEVQRTHKPPQLIIGNDQDVFKLTVPADAISRLPPEARRSAIVGVITIVCPGTIQLPKDFSQLSRTDLPIKCVGAGGVDLPIDQWVLGIKRIFVRGNDRNANPKVARVTWDGADWPKDEIKEVSACSDDGNRYDKCVDQEHHDVALTLTDDSYESGTDEFGTSFQEQVIVEYYATEGLFEHDVKVAKQPTTGFAARQQSRAPANEGGIITVFMVAHDNRGGVAWEERKVHVK